MSRIEAVSRAEVARPAPAWPRSAAVPPAAASVLVVLLGLLPVLRTPDFYFWDDSAAVFLPTWRAAGQDLLAGVWPVLRPDLWMGGNWAAEAQFGLFSPVNLAVMVLVALVPDLVVAATLVKLLFQVVLALGGYLLAREYGARRWPAAVVMAALPFAGFTLYYDTGSWIAGLMAFAWTPWFWWASRRVSRGVLNPFVMFVLGYLLMTNGNPYGALAAVLVLAGLALERLLARDARGFWRLFTVGALVGATAVAPYLPLVLTSSVGWRQSGGLSNDGFLVPDLGMLLGSSTPGALPYIKTWQGYGSKVPMTYSAWFLLPLAAWLPWRVIWTRAKELAALGAVGLVYLALTLGPSSVWLFRWPVRLLEYVWLPVFVVAAVLVSAGLVGTAWRVRASVTAFVVLWGAWAAASANPSSYRIQVTSLLLHAVLAAALVWAIVRSRRLVLPVLAAGTALVLGFQLAWVPTNRDVADWQNPSSPAALAAYAARYTAPVVQVASYFDVPVEARAHDWQYLLFGSMPAAAGVENVASYTGLGFNEFSTTLCMNHAGATTCPEAFAAAFAPAGDGVVAPHLVDALKANTVVAQVRLVPDAASFRPPAGWELQESNDTVVVFRRTEPLPWPGSRLAVAGPGVSVGQASATSTTERLRVSTGAAGGTLLFARLAWPGYSASASGAPLEVHKNAQGLLEVALPGGLSDAEVRLDFRSPGLSVGVPVLLAAILGAAGIGVLWWRTDPRRARTRPQDAAARPLPAPAEGNVRMPDRA